MLLGDSRQSDQRTQSFHFPIVVHQSLDPLLERSSAKLLVFTCTSKFKRSTGSESERVDALGLRAVEVIICMITRDLSVISMTSQASLSLSLSLPLTKVTDAQYRKRFRASYNTVSTSHISHTHITFTRNAADHNITQSVLTRCHLSQSIVRAGKMLSITVYTWSGSWVPFTHILPTTGRILPYFIDYWWITCY